MKSSLKSFAGAVAAGAIVLGAGIGVGIGDADARVSKGDISLKVTGKCSSPGDSIKEFYVWTPEKGKKRITSGKSGTVNFGTFRKNKTGNTYFNWKLTCKMAGTTGEKQKQYGGSVNGINYSYSVERFYDKTKNP